MSLRVGVVGGGSMGSGIAEVCAAAGASVQVVVTSEASKSAARARLDRSLDRRYRSLENASADRAALAARIEFTTSLADLADRDVVVEAIRESEPAKREMFALLDKVVADDAAVLASTTSGVPIGRLAQSTARPGRVVGLHFFSPVPAQSLVEVVPSLLTDPATVARAEAFVTAIGKTALRAPDRAGFVVNALLVPYLLAAIRMVESGFATAEGIDAAMTLGCNHPVGPLRLADLIGLDVVAGVAEAMHAEFREPSYAPPPLLLRKVEAAQLGKKSGIGFHAY